MMMPASSWGTPQLPVVPRSLRPFDRVRRVNRIDLLDRCNMLTNAWRPVGGMSVLDVMSEVDKLRPAFCHTADTTAS